MNIILTLPVIFIFVSLILSQNAFADTCAYSGTSLTAPQLFLVSDTIFTGTVSSITNNTNHEWKIEFNAEKIWKGKHDTKISVITNSLRGCGYALTVGEKYLVYANDSPLYTTFDLTRPVSEVQNDIKLFDDPKFQAEQKIKEELNKKLEIVKESISNMMVSKTTDIPINMVGVDEINSVLEVGIDNTKAILSEEEYQKKLKEMVGDIPIKIEFGVITALANKTENFIGNDLVPPSILPPLQQFKSGVPINEIKCKEGLELVYKKADDTSACVKTSTMIELVIRGWAEDNRVILGCTGDRVEKCYPSDTKEYRKALYEYYFGKNDNLPSDNFTKLQTINACTEHQICLGEFDNGTKIRVSCDYPVHGCGVVPFDKMTMPDDFGIVYSFGYYGNNLLDTKRFLFKPDLCGQNKEITLILSENDLEHIWEYVHNNDFFELGNFTNSCDDYGVCREIMPEQVTTLTVTANGETHSVSHRDSYLGKQGDGLDRFNNIVDTIQNTLDKKPEVRSIPKPNCGYQ
jgi:hypothetical protein